MRSNSWEEKNDGLSLGQLGGCKRGAKLRKEAVFPGGWQQFGAPPLRRAARCPLWRDGTKLPTSAPRPNFNRSKKKKRDERKVVNRRDVKYRDAKSNVVSFERAKNFWVQNVGMSASNERKRLWEPRGRPQTVWHPGQSPILDNDGGGKRTP